MMDEQIQSLLHGVIAEAVAFNENRKNQQICFCGHEYGSHNSSGCRSCKREGHVNPKMAAHQFKPNTYFKEDELDEARSRGSIRVGLNRMADSRRLRQAHEVPAGDKCKCGHDKLWPNSKVCSVCGREGDQRKSTVKEGKELKSTDQKLNCAVCGDKHPTSAHPQSIHTAKALAGENNVQESFWTKLKEEAEAHVEKCDACGKKHAPDVPCPDKKLLDELGEAKNKKPNFKSNQMTISTTPEDIRRRSKTAVGMPPPKKVIKSKLDKKPKYPQRFDEAVEPAVHQVLGKHGYKHTEGGDWDRYEHPDSSHNCPNCGSADHLTFHPYDFGHDRETGYHDAGEGFKCHNCGHRGDIEDAVRKPSKK
jgi:hypothetical protein